MFYRLLSNSWTNIWWFFYCRDGSTTWTIVDNYNYSISYNEIGIPTGRIDVDDYEVFQVIKQKQDLNNNKNDPPPKKNMLINLFINVFSIISKLLIDSFFIN